jgi:hypothetical protein
VLQMLRIPGLKADRIRKLPGADNADVMREIVSWSGMGRGL